MKEPVQNNNMKDFLKKCLSTENIVVVILLSNVFLCNSLESLSLCTAMLPVNTKCSDLQKKGILQDGEIIKEMRVNNKTIKVIVQPQTCIRHFHGNNIIKIKKNELMEQDCPICLEAVINTDEEIGYSRMLCCGNSLHIDCLTQNLQYQHNCPFCRSVISMYQNFEDVNTRFQFLQNGLRLPGNDINEDLAC